MIKYFLIRKEDNRIVSISDDRLIFNKDIFESRQIEITDENYNNLNSGDIPIIENEKLKFQPKLETEKIIQLEKLKKDLDKAKTITDLKILINKIIDK